MQQQVFCATPLQLACENLTNLLQFVSKQNSRLIDQTAEGMEAKIRHFKLCLPDEIV